MHADQVVRVMLPHGVRAHLIPVASVGNDRNPALCGTNPRDAKDSYWIGTANSREEEAVSRLELCNRCTDCLT